MNEKPKLTLQVYDRLIEMMRSSNMEDFFIGLEIYKNHERSQWSDILMYKSFGGNKRHEVEKELNMDGRILWRYETMSMGQLKEKRKRYLKGDEQLIFDRLYDEYNSY